MEVYRSDFYKIIRGYDGFQVWKLVSKHQIWLCVDVYDTFASAIEYIENMCCGKCHLQSELSKNVSTDIN